MARRTPPRPDRTPRTGSIAHPRAVVRRVLLGVALAATSVLIDPAAAQASARGPARERVLAVAKRYVGHARYREGGESPRRGFDCSGFTKYVFSKAHVATLPHSAEGQRSSHKLHRVSKQHRRAGDLVFYMSSGSAYHVAIYAGHGRQYAAATPRSGIRYQRVWSTHVRYARVDHT